MKKTNWVATVRPKEIQVQLKIVNIILNISRVSIFLVLKKMASDSDEESRPLPNRTTALPKSEGTGIKLYYH